MSAPKNLTEPVEASTPAERLLESTLPVAAAHSQGDLAGFQRALSEFPDATAADIWVASATGDVDAVRRFLATDPSLAGRRGGTRNWEPLLYLCFSRVLRLDPKRAIGMRAAAVLLLDAGADPNCHWLDPHEGDTSRETPLYGAAGVANDVELARLLVERGADPNDGETPYHMVEHDGVPCADFIYPNLEPRWRGCALGHKMDYDDLVGVRKLLELGCDPNGPTPFRMWPIHQAVFRNRTKPFFDLLIAHGADVNKPNGHGQTAYAMAARGNKTRIMKWLAEAGANTSLEPVDEFIAACAAGKTKRARAIAEANENIFASMTDRDRSEINESAGIGNTRGVTTMLDAGWDVNVIGVVWGETPAHRAALEGHVDTFELLVERGADLTRRDRVYNASPLGWAQHGEQPAVMQAIRNYPDRLDLWDAIELGLTDRALELVAITDPDEAIAGCTPGVLLRIAVAQGNVPVVRAMLERGADTSLKSGQNITPLDVARELGHTELVGILGG